MRVIIVGEKSGRCRHGRVTVGQFMLAVAVALVLLLAAAWSGYRVASERYEALPGQLVQDWQAEIEALREHSRELGERSAEERQAYTLRLASLQARLVRLDALGERLTGVAGLDQGEFDFSREPALGGPDTEPLDFDADAPELEEVIAQFERKLADREQQLQLMDGFIRTRQQLQETQLAGRPVRKGWMSSGFGRRTDPFHGRPAWHEGVDFAGAEGAEIIAVGAGVVTWSGERHGYGQMVEISHPDGYVTRYAHNRDNLVAVGDVVNRGQVIARMGSSGRSTGPHVHFEVLRHGKAIDPTAFIYRASR